ncbi:hypothetical protein B0O80DRAFT_526754 [Mortierella sp. GBAus27b]|nr:hypothetical protein B0O80DRAFT_526754 [Mortierella sp. GBAus27b]
MTASFTVPEVERPLPTPTLHSQSEDYHNSLDNTVPKEPVNPPISQKYGAARDWRREHCRDRRIAPENEKENGNENTIATRGVSTADQENVAVDVIGTIAADREAMSRNATAGSSPSINLDLPLSPDLVSDPKRGFWIANLYDRGFDCKATSSSPREVLWWIFPDWVCLGEQCVG